MLIWTVFAPAVSVAPGSLAETYGGATAGAAVGANVLVGGSSDAIALQPLSIQGMTGLNGAVVAAMTLTYQSG